MSRSWTLTGSSTVSGLTCMGMDAALDKLRKPQYKKKRKSSDNVTRKEPPPPRQLVTAWGCGAELLPLVTA